MEDVQHLLKEQVSTHPVVLYMKGTPDFPQCGFSASAVRTLEACGASFAYVNIFEDPELRDALKRYSNWPTYPQLYVKGEFIGGTITVGMKTSVEALAINTAQLPRVELVRPDKIIGTSTIKGIQSGIVYSNIGSTKYMIEKIKAEMGERNVKIIATGGLSELIAEQERLFDIIDRELSLEGLNIIYNLNQ